MIPRPGRKALHRQYGEMLLTRGEPAARAAGHLLQAAHPVTPRRWLGWTGGDADAAFGAADRG